MLTATCASQSKNFQFNDLCWLSVRHSIAQRQPDRMQMTHLCNVFDNGSKYGC